MAAPARLEGLGRRGYVAVDGFGNIYLTGFTEGDLGGPNAGGYDAFLAKYDHAGTLLSTTQLSSNADDVCVSVATDASGGVYISGKTYGDLEVPSAGGMDAFLVKLVIPEPATLDLLLIGSFALARRRR